MYSFLSSARCICRCRRTHLRNVFWLVCGPPTLVLPDMKTKNKKQLTVKLTTEDQYDTPARISEFLQLPTTCVLLLSTLLCHYSPVCIVHKCNMILYNRFLHMYIICGRLLPYYYILLPNLACPLDDRSHEIPQSQTCILSRSIPFVHLFPLDELWLLPFREYLDFE